MGQRKAPPGASPALPTHFQNFSGTLAKSLLPGFFQRSREIPGVKDVRVSDTHAHTCAHSQHPTNVPGSSQRQQAGLCAPTHTHVHCGPSQLQQPPTEAHILSSCLHFRESHPPCPELGACVRTALRSASVRHRTAVLPPPCSWNFPLFLFFLYPSPLSSQAESHLSSNRPPMLSHLSPQDIHIIIPVLTVTKKIKLG